MRDITLFVEDYAHRQVIGMLVQRIALEYSVTVRLDWRNATRGYGAVVREFRKYLRELDRQGHRFPDLIVLATDANCKGLNERMKEIEDTGSPEIPVPIISAVPDPHIERWLLLDGEAFKRVFGAGCDAPDQKCSRDRYKQRLIEAIDDAGTVPRLGGIEYAEDIVREMNIDRATRMDRSLERFVAKLRNTFHGTRPAVSRS